MLESIAILQPAGADFSGLQRAFRDEAGAECDVRLVCSEAELLAVVADRDRSHLAVVPRDLTAAGFDGLEIIVRNPLLGSAGAPVVVVAEKGDVESAARAIDAGATDLVVCCEPIRERIATLLGKLRSLYAAIDQNRRLDERNEQLRATIAAKFQLVGESPQMGALLERIRRVAMAPRPVLVSGERGTGKELVALAIHHASSAGDKPVVSVNCAAFSDSLLESELFGHQRGAFTGAEETRRGKFEQAENGTLFLDEIGNMSLPFQQKILRVVEYGVYHRVGGAEELQTSARIIAATNCDLKEKIRRQEFLPDLYDRLTFETLEVPALRDRAGDIELLAHYFLDQFAREIPAFSGKTLSRQAIEVLKRQPFPGNVRELKNVIERSAYRDTTGEITPADLGLLTDNQLLAFKGSFQEKIAAFTRRLIEDALQANDGNQAAAARQMGLTYHQFRYYLKKHQIAASAKQ